MSEKENMVVEETAVAQEKSSESFGAKFKEWLRKLTVKLKRKTQIIPLAVILITSLVYLCMIGTYSQVVELNSGISSIGISMFVNTLASILILPLFLNAFPKRKKVNLVYIALVFVVLALLIGMDLLFYFNTKSYVSAQEDTIKYLNKHVEISKAYTQLIVHMIFVGVSIVVFAFLPLYKKGINKINTRKNLEENNLSEQIDTSAEV